MSLMAEKKPKKPPLVPGQHSLRVDDKRLLEALDAYGEKVRRSRNMVIQLLIEKAMEEEGFWPPPSGDA
jgi:hypothetical protein